MPFRETHHIAGAAVKMAEDRGVSLDALTLSDLKTLHALFDTDVHSIWDFEKSIASRSAYGGTSESSVSRQVLELKQWLDLLEKE